MAINFATHCGTSLRREGLRIGLLKELVSFVSSLALHGGFLVACRLSGGRGCLDDVRHRECCDCQLGYRVSVTNAFWTGRGQTYTSKESIVLVIAVTKVQRTKVAGGMGPRSAHTISSIVPRPRGIVADLEIGNKPSGHRWCVFKASPPGDYSLSGRLSLLSASSDDGVAS